ncbi:MAG: DnaB-like helicase N-terminal domain-containing protein [Caulobacteraceae bacterium]|nr:DnaB-like helicase N-terminal domain-containing protein [Caulobacteraceae bacterium]
MTVTSKSRTPRANSSLRTVSALKNESAHRTAGEAVRSTAGTDTPLKAIPALVERTLQAAHAGHHRVKMTILVEPGSQHGAINIERLLTTDEAPAAVNAEQALLGLLLFDNAVFDQIRGHIEASDFHEPLHGRLFAEIEAEIKEGKLAEPIMMAERFRFDPAFEKLGGLRYLADLIDRAPAPGSKTAQANADLVHDLAVLRRNALPGNDDADDLGVALAEARIRGAGRAAEILAGPDMLSADEFAALIGVTREAVRQKMIRREILGLQGAKRGTRYPAWQVTQDGALLPELRQVFRVLGDSPWAVYRFLTEASMAFKGAPPLEALRSGAVGPVLEAAEGIARGDFG